MINTLQQGTYRLTETKGQTKILTLDDDQMFAWVWTAAIGELLVTTHAPHKMDHVLAVGEYYIYDVQDEPNLTDIQHLELSVGQGQWQGYLLLTGLPNDQDKRRRIVPTTELIPR